MGTDVERSCPSARGSGSAHFKGPIPAEHTGVLTSPGAIKRTGQLLESRFGVRLTGDSRFPREPVVIFAILCAALRVRLQTAMPSTPVGKATLVIYRQLPQLGSCATCNTNQLFSPSSLATHSDG